MFVCERESFQQRYRLYVKLLKYTKEKLFHF